MDPKVATFDAHPWHVFNCGHPLKNADAFFKSFATVVGYRNAVYQNDGFNVLYKPNL
jgi:hypothetical protein